MNTAKPPIANSAGTAFSKQFNSKSCVLYLWRFVPNYAVDWFRCIYRDVLAFVNVHRVQRLEMRIFFFTNLGDEAVLPVRTSASVQMNADEKKSRLGWSYAIYNAFDLLKPYSLVHSRDKTVFLRWLVEAACDRECCIHELSQPPVHPSHERELRTPQFSFPAKGCTVCTTRIFCDRRNSQRFRKVICKFVRFSSTDGVESIELIFGARRHGRYQIARAIDTRPTRMQTRLDELRLVRKNVYLQRPKVNWIKKRSCPVDRKSTSSERPRSDPESQDWPDDGPSSRGQIAVEFHRVGSSLSIRLVGSIGS